jgi:hypothetical protein
LAAEVFSLQAELLDPVGQLAAAHGGGSLSALIAVEASEPIPGAPMNIEYLVDHTYRLSPQLFHSGQRPAITPARTVSKLALDCAREVMQAHPLSASAGATSPDAQVVVIRVLSPVVEPAMALLKQVWQAWRTQLWQLAPSTPRIWSM